MTTVRVTMPWDVAHPGVAKGEASNPAHDMAALRVVRSCLDSWLQAVFARGLQPEIDFRGDVNFAWANGQVLMPSLAQYRGAMVAFREAYVDCRPCADGGQVKVIAAWNEPDNQGQSHVGSVYDLLFPDGRTHLAGSSCPAHPIASNCGAVMAAKMWVVDYQVMVQGASGGRACSGCALPAGDFSAGQGFLRLKGTACPNTCPYVFLYNRSLTSGGKRLRPGHWAVHPYTDTKAFQSGATATPTRLSQFASKLRRYGYGPRTFIWLNEVSVCDAPGPGTCAKHVVKGKTAAMNYLLGSLALSVDPTGPQVGRIDYYCFDGAEAKCNNDWGLVNNGTLTAAGQTYAAWAAKR